MVFATAALYYASFDVLATPGRKRTMDMPALSPLEAGSEEMFELVGDPALCREVYFFCNARERLLARNMTYDEYCAATDLTPKGFYWEPRERARVDPSVFLLVDAARHGTWQMVEDLIRRHRFPPEVVEFIRDGAYPEDVIAWQGYRRNTDLETSVGNRLEWAGRMAASEALLDIPRRAQPLLDFYEKTCAALTSYEAGMPEDALWFLPLFRRGYRDRVHSEWLAYGQQIARRIPGGSQVMISSDSIDGQVGHIVPKKDVRVRGSFYRANYPLAPLPEGWVLEKPDYGKSSLIVLSDLLAAERIVEPSSWQGYPHSGRE